MKHTLWGVVMAAWLMPAQLWAEASPSSLRVEVISCVLQEGAVDVTEMLAIARAELAPRELGTRQSDADGEPILRVDACHDEHLILRLLKPPGPERRISLHDVPVEHRPRVAALALAELVIASRAQPESEPAEKAPPKAQTRAPSEERASRAQPLAFPDWNPVEERAESHHSKVGVGSEARLFTESMGFTFGPRLDFNFRHLDVSLVALVGRHREDLGQYRVGLIALSPRYALYRSRSKAQFALSIGGEIGFTWGSARPYEDVYGPSTNAFSPFLSGFAQLGLSGPLSVRTYGQIAFTGGYAMGVYARRGREVEASTRGPFAGAQLGLAWAM